MPSTGYFLKRSLCLFVVWYVFGGVTLGGLFVQEASRSPDGKTVLAINYPPTGKQPDDAAQFCFLSGLKKQRVGDFFFLPETFAETDHPGTYKFDNYHEFDYAWSSDATCVAIALNRRRFSVVYPFRRVGPAFQLMTMPDLFAPLEKRMTKVVEQGRNGDTRVEGWGPRHHLIVTVSKDARIPGPWSEDYAWKVHALRCTVAFDHDGAPTVVDTRFRVHDPP